MAAARTTSVPKAMQPVYETVTEMTDAFCGEHLNDDYRDLCRAMAAALCRKRPSPIAPGKARVWACGIVYALGQINFLSDKATEPFMTMAQVAKAFGVSQSTASARARTISNALRIRMMDPRWTLPSLLDQNPMIWMAEVNGMVVDLRDMPREIQEAAFEQGSSPTSRRIGAEGCSPGADIVYGREGW